MKASVIVLAWNGKDYMADCLASVFAQEYPDFEVIVVDNGSTDGSADWVAEHYPQVKLIRNERNLGFAAGNNIGLRAATGDVLVLLNQDTVVHTGWLAALVKVLDDPAIGIVGCKILYPDGTIQHAGAYLYGVDGRSEHIGRREPDTGQYDQLRDVDFVTGASLALTRSTFAKIGPLDEGFAPAYYEDTDWCYRARAAGLRVVYAPAAVVTHYESTATQPASYMQKAMLHYGRLRLLFKHKPLLWLGQEFAPAEMNWAKQLGRTVEMMAVRDAYVRLVLSLPEILAFRLRPGGIAQSQDPQKEWNELLAMVSDLQNSCVQDQPLETLYTQLEYTEEHAIGAQVQKAASGQMSESDLAQSVWGRLAAQWEVKEQPFHSNAPVLGSGIAAFREAWNNISTRWYVLPMLQQQVMFNRSVVDSQAESAFTQIAILHIMKQVLGSIEDQRRDVAQSVRDIDRLAQALAQLQRIEASKSGEEKEHGQTRSSSPG